jgi:hypothetical protein
MRMFLVAFAFTLVSSVALACGGANSAKYDGKTDSQARYTATSMEAASAQTCKDGKCSCGKKTSDCKKGCGGGCGRLETDDYNI